MLMLMFGLFVPDDDLVKVQRSTACALGSADLAE